MTRQDSVLLLSGLDAANPLAFLATIGTLRALDAALPGRRWRLSWSVEAAGWRPQLHAGEPASGEEVVQVLAGFLARTSGHPAFLLGDDLKATPEEFRVYARQAAEAATPEDRSWADFVTAFGCEAAVDLRAKEPEVRDTAFRTMSGAGHQHFLAFMRHILSTVEEQHLEAALFEPWRYEDPVEKSTMRWDPLDDVRYALRWRDPSGDPERGRSGSMLGANALAIHGLPLFSTAPIEVAGVTQLMTTGFRGRGARDTAWTWPIWEGPATLDVVRSLLALSNLQDTHPDRSELAARGVVEVYRSRRITTGKYRNFTPAEPTRSREDVHADSF